MISKDLTNEYLQTLTTHIEQYVTSFVNIVKLYVVCTSIFSSKKYYFRGFFANKLKGPKTQTQDFLRKLKHFFEKN